MKELDNEMIEELRYFESINQDVSLSYAEDFICKYSTWEAVQAVEGVLLDDYFVTLGNNGIYGVAFLGTPKNTQLNYYNIKIYESPIELENAYQERYIQYLECVIDKEDAEKNAIEFLIEKIKEGLTKHDQLIDEVYNLDYYARNDNDSLYIQYLEMNDKIDSLIKKAQTIARHDGIIKI